MTRCRCGNVLDANDGRGYTYIPASCQCRHPGHKHPSNLRHATIPEGVTDTQYAERVRTGLPIATDSERAMLREIHS